MVDRTTIQIIPTRSGELRFGDAPAYDGNEWAYREARRLTKLHEERKESNHGR